MMMMRAICSTKSHQLLHSHEVLCLHQDGVFAQTDTVSDVFHYGSVWNKITLVDTARSQGKVWLDCALTWGPLCLMAALL